MPLKDINAKHVVVIVTFLLTTAGLVAFGKDIAAFVVVGLAVLGGIGVVISKQAETKQETAQIREQTNGSQTALINHLVELAKTGQEQNRQLMALIEGQARMLAGATVPAEVLALPAPTSPARVPEPPAAVDPQTSPGPYGSPPGGYPSQRAA